jgi:hypothetical protein
VLPPLSYAQRFEDFHLWRALGDVANGFYVDIGAGHPVFDNVSFAFYLAGWRGVTVEPNPALAALARAGGRAISCTKACAARRPGKRRFICNANFMGSRRPLPSTRRRPRKKSTAVPKLSPCR